MILSKIIPLGFLSIGIILLLQVILPIASFQLWLIGQKYNNNILISPNFAKGAQVLGVSVQNKDNFPSIVSSLKRDLKASYVVFSLSVPKLKIERAQVEVDSNDLSNGLVHLPGS